MNSDLSQDEIRKIAFEAIVTSAEADHFTFMDCVGDDCLIVGDVIKDIKSLGLGVTATGKLMSSPTNAAVVLEAIGMSYFATVMQLMGLSKKEFIEAITVRMKKTALLDMPPRNGFRLLKLMQPQETKQ